MSKEIISHLPNYSDIPVFPSEQVKRFLNLEDAKPENMFEEVMDLAGIVEGDSLHEAILSRNVALAKTGDAVWTLAIAEWSNLLGLEYNNIWSTYLHESYKQGLGLQLALADQIGIGNIITERHHERGESVSGRSVTEAFEAFLGGVYPRVDNSELFYRLHQGIASLKPEWLLPFRGDSNDYMVLYPGSQIIRYSRDGIRYSQLIDRGGTLIYEAPTDKRQVRGLSLDEFIKRETVVRKEQLGINPEVLLDKYSV